MNIYVVRGHSESGDDYIAAFYKKPTDAELKDLCYKWDGPVANGIDDEGPGEYGSFVHLTITKEKLIGWPPPVSRQSEGVEMDIGSDV